LFDQNRYHPKRLPCHCYLAPYKTIPQPQPYSKHAEVTVPSLDDWEKEWGGKFATQCATKVAAGGFPVAVGCHRAIELTLQLVGHFTSSNCRSTVAARERFDLPLGQGGRKALQPDVGNTDGGTTKVRRIYFRPS
jgi:hypothetical protein